MKESRKILFVCQYFYPEVFRGNDIAFHLAEKSYDVHVVTGTPNYPSGKFYGGYGIFKKSHEMVNGVKVTYLPIFPRGNTKIMLMLNYFSYMIVGCVYMLFHTIGNKYDMVFCQQLSPVMMSAPAVLYKKLRHAPLYTWVLDLWPESLSVAGGINNQMVLKFFDWFVKNEYKWSDKILISSRSFCQSILSYGNYQEKIVYFPQWSDSNMKIAPKGLVIPDIPQGFVVMFAGAIGEAHGMECTMKAALMTKNHKNIKWVIVGDGRKLDWVRQFVKSNRLDDTVFLMGRYPQDTMPMFYEKANVMLVSLNDSSLFNLYAPAKISSYMASGRPIITCMNGEGSEIVKTAQCGWSVKAGDAEGLSNLVIELSKTDKGILDAKGKGGRKYYEEFFDKEKCLDKLEVIMGLTV